MLFKSIRIHKTINLVQLTCKRTMVGKTNFRYENHYRGHFDYHDQNKYPRRLARSKEEELLDDIAAIRKKEIEPSPFHLVKRIESMSHCPWWQKVILRRLNLHSTASGDVEVIPNTPQFNALLSKVKHLIQLKPATFEDGSLITENDIGSLKICFETGKITKDDRLRQNEKRLCPERPVLFRGNHLRYQLARLHRF